MTAEINILTAAHDHQAELLAEAEARRLIRRSNDLTSGLAPAAKRRLNILLRRLAGAPTFV